MRLRIETPGDTPAPYWFVGRPDVSHREFTDAMSQGLNILRNQRSEGGAGYHAHTHEDLGNQRCVLTATTCRTFANAQERMAFIAALAPADPGDAEHPWEGDVYLREEDGDEWTEWKLEGAVISLNGDVRPEGAVALMLSYRVMFGGFSATPTVGTYDWLLDEDGNRILDEDGHFIEAD